MAQENAYTQQHSASGEPEFVITHIFDAPRQQLWDTWTKPELMAQWWGPKGFTSDAYTMDFVVGGTYHYCIKSPQGQAMWGKFIYEEIDAPSRMVFINGFSDEQGAFTRHPMSPTWPLKMRSTILFEDKAGKTEVTIRWQPIDPSEEERKTFEAGMSSMQQGWSGTLQQLTDFLAAHKI